MEDELKVFDKRHWVNPDAAKDDGKEPDLKRLPNYVAQLEERMAQNDAKLKEYIAAYKQKMAENDEFRARLEKDVDRRVEARLADFFRQAAPLLDNLELALDSAAKTGDAAKLVDGLGMILAGYKKVFGGFGLAAVDCLGKPFNPAEAEAVQMAEVAEKEKDNTVLAVVQNGYRMNETLIRPARVVVGKCRE